jgi:hypothetical protein
MVALVALACGFRSAMYPWKSADTGDETMCDETTPENPERSLGALEFRKGCPVALAGGAPPAFPQTVNVHRTGYSSCEIPDGTERYTLSITPVHAATRLPDALSG